MANTQNSFTYNGVNSLTDLGLRIIESSSSWAMPERDVSQYEIPGRSGLVLIDNNRWKERIITYQVLAQATEQDELRKAIDKIKFCLTSNYGEYKELTDTISRKTTVHTVFGTERQLPMYRLATFIGPIDWDTTLMRKGTCELSFICLPYNFVRSGNMEQQINNNDYTQGLAQVLVYSLSGLPKYTITFCQTDGTAIESYKPSGDGDIYIYTFNDNGEPGYEDRANAVGCTHIHLTADTPEISNIVIDTLEKEVYTTDGDNTLSLNAFADLTDWAVFPEIDYTHLQDNRLSMAIYTGKSLSADDTTGVIPSIKIELDTRGYTI